MELDDTLAAMHAVYAADPVKAVRGQGFIKPLHDYLEEQLTSRLSARSKSRGVVVRKEANVFGSHKPKAVDVAVVDPDNGPLVLVGVRSQMSSVGKNAANYYEGIIGECISLQDRFPMSCHGYVYLHPHQSTKPGREKEVIDHSRYARWYEKISGRSGQDFMLRRGIFDQFGYMVVDFNATPISIRDDIVEEACPGSDLQVSTFVDRLVATFRERDLFIDLFS